MKKLFVAAVLWTSLLANATIYSSRLWEERAPFCHKTEATAEVVVKNGLTPALLKNIQTNPAVKELSLQDQLTIFDVMYLADKRKSSYWAFDYCMDRLET